MSLYNQEFNKDKSTLRYIIVATLAELQNRVYYYNLVNDQLKKIDVPFYYSITGSERFLQDNFIYDAEENGKAVGDYEVVPRGMLQMTGYSINDDELTNKYTNGNLLFNCKDGIVRTFSGRFCYKPITMSFDCTIICTSHIEILKVSESLVSKLSEPKLFIVDLGMFSMEAALVIPNEFTHEKTFEFQVDTKKECQITFSIEVKSFIPVLDYGMLVPELSIMIDDYIEKDENKSSSILTLRTDNEGNLSICGGNVMDEIHLTEYEVHNIHKDKNQMLSSLDVFNENDTEILSNIVVKKTDLKDEYIIKYDKNKLDGNGNSI